jgi:hypothetical protein
VTTVPGIPDCDIAPVIVPGYLKNAEAVLSVETHFVVGQMNFLAIFVCPIF